MKYYLAGPMTGLPDLNYPAFFAAEELITSLGHQAENPAQNHCEAFTWLDYMKAGIAQMLRCDAVATLPDWEASKGARIEVELAERIGMPVVRVCDVTKAQRYVLIETEPNWFEVVDTMHRVAGASLYGSRRIGTGLIPRKRADVIAAELNAHHEEVSAKAPEKKRRAK